MEKRIQDELEILKDNDDIVNIAVSIPVEFKVPSPGVTKFLLKDVASTFFERHGIQEIITRKKYGMPAALSPVEEEIKNYVSSNVSDNHFINHPYKEHNRIGSDLANKPFIEFTYFSQAMKNEDFKSQSGKRLIILSTKNIMKLES